MPMLTKEMFDEPPSVGDSVIVRGTIQRIDGDDVEISYDSVENKGKQGDEEGMDKPMNAGDSLDEYMRSKPKGDTQ